VLPALSGGEWRDEVDTLAERPFVDRYEVLQLSPNASTETIERVYRLLAKRYHPDNLETGDADRFAEVCDAFDVLSDPVRRAAYDVTYDEQRNVHMQIFRGATSGDTRGNDRRLFHGVLSLLYVARRRDPYSGGMGAVHLEKMLACPQEHLAFPIWYLKQHGYIETLNNGQMAITVAGIDHLGNEELFLPSERLLPAASLEATSAVS